MVLVDLRLVHVSGPDLDLEYTEARAVDVI
jgi:hypothetical protein